MLFAGVGEELPFGREGWAMATSKLANRMGGNPICALIAVLIFVCDSLVYQLENAAPEGLTRSNTSTCRSTIEMANW